MQITPLPAFQDNYIWVIHTQGMAIVVDPGIAAPVREFLLRERLLLMAILITHPHADHQGGAAELFDDCQEGVFGASRRIYALNRLVASEDILSIGNFPAVFRVLTVPGHTLDHVAYYLNGMLFCGDTLFSVGCGRVFEGTPAQMLASLDKLASLPEDTLVYCAHEYTAENIRFAMQVEPHNLALQQRSREVAQLRNRHLPTIPSTLRQEKATNPFLRVRQSEVIEAARRRSPQAADPPSVFAALRSWKDTF